MKAVYVIIYFVILISISINMITFSNYLDNKRHNRKYINLHNIITDLVKYHDTEKQAYHFIYKSKDFKIQIHRLLITGHGADKLSYHSLPYVYTICINDEVVAHLCKTYYNCETLVRLEALYPYDKYEVVELIEAAGSSLSKRGLVDSILHKKSLFD